MKIRAHFLLVTAMFLSGFVLVGSDSKNIHGKKEERVEHKTFFEKTLESENNDIGAKLCYGGIAAEYYKNFLRATCNGNTKESELYWLEFQKYRQRFNETRTPYVANVFAGGFGYWLYRRMAYPANKKNWGACKKAIASIMIPMCLFGGTLFADQDVDKKKDDLNAQQEEIIKELQKKNVEILAKNEELQQARKEDESNFSRAFNKCMGMSEQERRAWMTPGEKEAEAILLAERNKKEAEIEALRIAEQQRKTEEENKMRTARFVIASTSILKPIDEPVEELVSRAEEKQSSWKKYLGWYWFKKKFNL